MATLIVIFISKYLPSVFDNIQQERDMEGSNKKKTVYLTTLENLFQELKQARSVSSGGRKLILLGLLYDVHRVHQFFMQIENNLSESIEIPNLLLYDADVDYNQWSVDFDIKFDVNPFYMPDEEEEDAGESSVKQTLWHIFDTLSRDELKEIVCDRTNNVQLLSGILTNDITADQLALLLNESIVVLRESLVHIHTCISRHKMTNDEGEQLYRHEKEIFRMKYENAVVEKFEEWKDTFDDDEDVLKRNLNGKYCTEMLTLFISGFLAPRISAQVETDTTSLEEEFTKLNFFNIPNTMDAKAHYSALRELFNYNNKVVVPKTAQIGKYFFKHRKHVDAKQRMALFEFIKMIELIEEEKKPKREKTEIINKGKNEQASSKMISKNLFYNIIQYEQPELLLEKLHQLIDERKGADVGCVLLKCLQDGYITRRPTQKEFKSEFTLDGSWTSIHNYMDDNNENALDRANRVIIF